MSVATAAPPFARSSHTDRLAPCRIETGQRPPGKAREPVQRLAHKARVAAKGRHDVGLDRRVVRAGHVEFRAGWDDHGRLWCADRRAERG